jgi:uncharacterized repeat protein (TIGR01451 family)
MFTVLALCAGGAGASSPTWMSESTGSSASFGLLAVAFPDAHNGWTVNADGGIFHTSDGGSSWGIQTSGTNAELLGLSFVNANDGWISAERGVILHTSDGGAAWSVQSSGTTNNLWGVSFVDSSDGWMVGTFGTIIHTADGGTTWSAQTGNGKTYLAVDFLDPNNGWIVGISGTLLHTTDGGATWSVRTSGTTANLNALSFADANHGWVVGDNGTILHTSDGGATWSQQESGRTENLYGVGFVNTSEGWAVGQAGTILHTSDGGATWTAATGTPNETLTAISTVAGAGVWVSGDSATMLHLNLDNDLSIGGVGDITASATNDAGAPVTFSLPAAIDEGSETPAVTCDHSSGEVFPVGTTTVTCTATDSDDDPSSVQTTFDVTVNDADLAITNVPSDMTVEATSTAGASVDYTLPTVVDEDSSAPPVVCSPASGSTFAVGTTSVACSATDADDSNSPATVGFKVTVHSSPGQSISPSSLGFGDQPLGSTSTAKTVTLTSSGTASLVVGTLGISGANAGDFSLTNDGCSGQTVAPGNHCTVDVQFSPTAIGGRSASLNIPGNAPSSPGHVPLSGNGTVLADVQASVSGPASAKSGSTASYLVTVGNAGPSTASNVVMTFAVPAGTKFQGVSTTHGTCTHPPTGSTTGTITCSLGNLAKGANGLQSVALKITLNKKGGTITGVIHAASVATNVTPATPDPNLANNVASFVTTVG